ncbi:S8 family peptidase [bacterium]|nr:S8 family peptidase [bacterium]
MKKSFKRCLVLIIGSIPVLLTAGGSALEKMDAELRALITGSRSVSIHRDHVLQKGNDGISRVYILAEGDGCGAMIRQAGGRVHTDLGRMVTATVPLNKLEDIARQSAIIRLCVPCSYRYANDFLRADIHANEIYMGQPPLTRPYTGNNVIIGIIDTGIDVTHPDFRHADGTTRILSVWDQGVSGTHPPSGTYYDFGYGHEWTKTDIDNGLCTHTDTDGHGTHVTGIAAGNGSGNGQYRGIAPGADLIIVADNDDIQNGIVDAVNYIYGKARSLGRPCVINASLGGHQGPHDATHIETRMLDELITAYPGRAFCAAAGNEGNDFIHIAYPASADSFYTYVHPGPAGLVLLNIRIHNTMLNQVRFAIGWDDHDYNPFTELGGPLQFGGATPWFSAQETVDNLGFYERASDIWTGEEVGRVSFEVDTQNDSITVMQILIEDDVVWDEEAQTAEGMALWRLKVWNPDSRMHVWIADRGFSYRGSIANPHYRVPDNDVSVGMPAVARNIIAVGASVNRETYVDQFGTTYSISDDPAGSLAVFSSRGPTADGRLKPEVTAPGHGVISSLSIHAKNTGNVFGDEIIQGGQYALFSGTSMSCPAVSGLIALYLELHPDATARQIISTVTQSARQDDYTGIQLPDNAWGYGKADGFTMLTRTGVFQAEPLKPGGYALWTSYPNPFNASTVIRVRIPDAMPIRLTVTNIRGQQVALRELDLQQPGIVRIGLNSESWPGGLYLYTIRTPRWTGTGKMILKK